MIAVNLLEPKVSFVCFPVAHYRTRFAQARPSGTIGPRFPRPTPKINFSPRAELYLATCSEFRTNERVDNSLQPSQAHSPSASRGALLWALVRLFDSGQPKSEAVLSYLAKQEAREVNP